MVELERLRRRNERLETELARTRLALEITGKAHALLEMLSESAATDPKSKPRSTSTSTHSPPRGSMALSALVYRVSGWPPHGSARQATTAYFFLVVGVAFVGGAAMPKAFSTSMWQVSLK